MRVKILKVQKYFSYKRSLPQKVFMLTLTFKKQVKLFMVETKYSFKYF